MNRLVTFNFFLFPLFHLQVITQAFSFLTLLQKLAAKKTASEP